MSLQANDTFGFTVCKGKTVQDWHTCCFVGKPISVDVVQKDTELPLNSFGLITYIVTILYFSVITTMNHNSLLTEL